MSVQGVPRFDAVTLGDITADFKAKATISLKGVAAFVDSETGMTHGWTRGEGPVWSKETMVKLQELKDLMERDLAKIHFREDSVHAIGAPKTPGLNFPSGIGQHLGHETPSV